MRLIAFLLVLAICYWIMAGSDTNFSASVGKPVEQVYAAVSEVEPPVDTNGYFRRRAGLVVDKVPNSLIAYTMTVDRTPVVRVTLAFKPGW